MRNIALLLSYLGTEYHGFQLQKTDRTIAGELNRALSRVFGHRASVVGCGRTDAGVHAEVYVANVKTESAIPADRLPYAVNACLPPDIAVFVAKEVDSSFHAVFSSVGKEYTYRISCGRVRSPFLADRVHFYPRALDVSAMREAASHLVGTHDFRAMRSVGSNVKTTIRTVEHCTVETRESLVAIRVKANGFLYNMARAIAGTLLYVSEGKIAPADIPGILQSGDRMRAGPTAPPQGLYMTGVWYPEDVLAFDAREGNGTHAFGGRRGNDE
ncbi:tRNA pseudouridine(38-40) synthase TruA [Oscillospiraceae bacterium OttesenSCG-928-G22]|nr:tRNA pseudouridine(38-40) synthase TruA [Oscillospiraceae bacterium OttesenSCG-928-G22]